MPEWLSPQVRDLGAMSRARVEVEEVLAATSSSLWAVVNCAAILVMAKVGRRSTTLLCTQIGDKNVF